MSCFWRHQWSEWSNPKIRNMVYDMAGTDGLVKGIEHFQQRTCARCNVVQEKVL